jgi:hypothetical protein
MNLHANAALSSNKSQGPIAPHRSDGFDSVVRKPAEPVRTMRGGEDGKGTGSGLVPFRLSSRARRTLDMRRCARIISRLDER